MGSTKDLSADFCFACGEKFKNEHAVICPNCGAGQKPMSGREWSPGLQRTLFILSFLLPIVGGIAGFVGLFSDANRGAGVKLIVASFFFWIMWSLIFMFALI